VLREQNQLPEIQHLNPRGISDQVDGEEDGWDGEKHILPVARETAVVCASAIVARLPRIRARGVRALACFSTPPPSPYDAICVWGRWHTLTLATLHTNVKHYCHHCTIFNSILHCIIIYYSYLF
jgi:hypothetical protein